MGANFFIDVSTNGVDVSRSDVIRIFRPVRKNIAEGIVELYENVQGQKPRVGRVLKTLVDRF